MAEYHIYDNIPAIALLCRWVPCRNSSSMLHIWNYPATDLVISIMTLLAGIIIFILAPVETANKPLDHTELSVYRKRTRIILLSDICIITILLAFDLNSIALCMGVALMVLSFMVVLGKMNQDAVTS